MKMSSYFILIGIISSIINLILYIDNDPAMWGWLNATLWACALFVRELNNKQ